MSHGPAEWDVQETLIARLRREAEELMTLRERLDAAEHELEDLRSQPGISARTRAGSRLHRRVASTAGPASLLLYGTLTDDLCMLAARIH